MSHRRFLIAQTLVPLVALTMALAPLAGVLHDTTRTHQWCEAHGHYVHGESSVMPGPEARGADSAVSARSAGTGAEGEDACTQAPGSRRIALAPGWARAPRPSAAVASATLPCRPARPAAVLAVAPKQGPPSA